VSTLREAEYFADHGIADIQYAVCITPDKLGRAGAVAGRIPAFSAVIDSPQMARVLADWTRSAAVPFAVWIEIDSGEHRTGLSADDPKLVETAHILAGSPVRIAGVATHGGHSYGEREAAGIARVAEQERLAVVQAAETLRRAGIAIEGVSAGSTPTAVHAQSGDGLTEIRAGVYMASDLFQAAIGSSGEEDIAVSVLATVISRNEARNQIVIDAGGLALSKDRATGGIEKGDLDYGLVADIEGRASFGRLTVGGVHQEHGEIEGETPLPFDRLAIGTRLRILPNHVCMTAGAHDRFLVVDGGTAIVAEWEKATGW
jgi:D-serine deaminase-like pyridoxal phosphate-dependent protein